jgi:DNA-binding response OmpR family regulator
MKTLLIEDDPGTIDAIKLCLEIYKPEVNLVCLDHGKEAIQKLKSDTFDCVLIDLGLPDIDGLEILKQIREFSQIPAIAGSARHQKESMTKALELGANQYISKPFNPRLLVSSLEMIKTK